MNTWIIFFGLTSLFLFGLNSVNSVNLLDLTGRQLDSFIRTSIKNGDNLLLELDNPDLGVFIKYLDNMFDDMAFMDAIITSQIDFMSKDRKVLVDSVAKMCILDLEYSLNYVNYRIEGESNESNKTLLNAIKTILTQTMENVKEMKDKIIKTNQRFLSEKENVVKIHSIINRFQFQIITKKTFKSSLKKVKKIIVFLKNMDSNQDLIEGNEVDFKFDEVLNQLKEAKEKEDSLHNNLYDILSKRLTNWIIDFHLKNDVSNTIKKHHLDVDIKKFNKKAIEVIEILEKVNSWVKNHMLKKISFVHGMIEIQELIETAIKQMKVKDILMKYNNVIQKIDNEKYLKLKLVNLKKFIEFMFEYKKNVDLFQEQDHFLSESTGTAVYKVKALKNQI